MSKFYTCACMVVLLLSSFSVTEAAPRQEVVSGPVTGQVLDVYDGDTVTVKIHVWIGQEIETSVRIDGIDAPEMKGKCTQERTMAEAARQELIRLLNNQPVRISNIRLEKYAGRVLAQMQTADGIDISEHMLKAGLVRPYHGKKRQPWCMS